MWQIIYWIQHQISNCYSSTSEWMHHLDKQQWLVLLVLTTAAGFVCMRGFGSRQ